MSYNEYFDLFLEAQENPDAKYYVVSFDTVDSKLLNSNDRRRLQDNIDFIMKYIYEKLLEKEKLENRQILIKDERFYRPWDVGLHHDGNFQDPSVLGDNFEFTVLRDTISKKEIVDWFYECKLLLNIEEDFHIADGYYETNNYEEGSTKLFRGYCLQILSVLHKPEVQRDLKKIQKKVYKKTKVPTSELTSKK